MAHVGWQDIGWVVVLMLVFAGCNRAEPRGITGTISLDGKPLDEAVILFVPLAAGQKKTGAKVVAGHFKVSPEVGLLPGEYRVEVADDPPLTAENHRTAQRRQPSRRRPFPYRYSVDSPLTLTLLLDGPNEFHFALLTKAK
jgi:hypothetical protein